MGGGGGGRGNGQSGQQQQQPAANGGEATETAGFQRGLDSGLAKAAPSAVGLSQKTYRSFRRRLELFSRQCLRRGKETAVEGAYLVMSQLQDVAWDAAESIDYDDIELETDPFKPIRKVLDVLFQHEEEVELPERCQEFFEQFSRDKGEELQAYLVRHQTLLKKLKDLKVEIPPLLAGWHMLTRAGLPRWTHPQVKALCGGDLNVQNVAKAMTKMFGGDSKPNSKDTVFRNTRDELHYLDQNEYFPDEHETQEVYYNDEFEEWPEEEIDEIDYVGCDDEEVVAEIDEASVAVEDAYINYLDSRKKMRELALARGFYPVVALDMGGGYNNGGGSKGGHKGSSKTGGGKGKGKKSGSKGHGKGFQPPGTRRYVYGARRGKGEPAGGSNYNDRTAPKSTTSGSTAQHGPRFKRYRLPASGIKEVPDDVQMVTEMDQVPITQSIQEEINAVDTAVGWAIMDSGATRSVCGEATWNQINEYLLMRGLSDKVDSKGESRDFRFGDGAVVRSKVSVTIPVCVAKSWKELKLHVLPGETPLLLARPDLERWKVVVDYGNKMVRVDGVAVKPAYTSNGHYMLNIFDDLQDVLNVEEFVAKKEDEDEDETTYVNSMVTDDVSDLECDVEVTLDEGVVEESIYSAVHNSEEHNRVLKFWETYVDEGRLGQYLACIGDVQVSRFTLPDWDFCDEEQRKEFRRLAELEEPHHVMVAPECRLWSPMQNLNYRTPERKEELQNLRVLEEHSHLQFYKDIHVDGKRIGYDTTLEQPADGMSWKTETLESMRGYYETVLDRCRTGLKAHPEDKLFVKKPTRFRSTSRKVAEAVNLRCLCGNNGHTQMFGRGAVLKRMQNYELPLVRRLGEAIYEAMEEQWKRRGQAELMMMEMVDKSTEEMKYLEQNKELIKIGGQEALRSVALLHKQLGHPSGARLVAAIQERNLPSDYVKVARKYQCPTCLAKQQPKAVRVATLLKVPHFNHTLSIDTFYLLWGNKKLAVFTMMDEFSRYEIDVQITDETAEMEIALMESTWMRCFGFPAVLRMDASGPHQGQVFADWCSAHGMKMELIPRGAHHRLGILERNHAVRRKMLEVFKMEMPECSLDKALLATCHQRNRLSSVKGSSPATLAFAYVPSEGGNMDDPGPEHFGDETDLAKVTRVKEAAAIAFHKANQDLAVRAAALHRARVETEELEVGDYVYYWKPQTNKLDPFRWRGPSLVVCVEQSTGQSSKIYWIVHGSSLVRCTRQQLRQETVPERYERQSKPEFAPSLKQPLRQRLLSALRPVRGPVRAVDAASIGDVPGDVPSPSDPTSADASEPPGYVTKLTLARNDDAEPLNPGGLWQSQEEAEEEAVMRDILGEVAASAELDPANSTGPISDAQRQLHQRLQEAHPEMANPRNEIAESEEVPMEVARTKEKRHLEEAVRYASRVSEDRNRRLDGLPPRMSDGQSEPKQAKMDEIHYVEVESEEVMMAVVESRLSPEEKKNFVEAKRKSLVPWCENDAWRPVKRTEAPNGTIVPMRFLLRYKEDKPNARVILQGFKHRDVVQGKLDTESPTLSRLGKYLIVLLGCIKRWKFGTMDVKSAFLQSDYIHHKVQLYGEPSADMRRLLSEMIGLKEARGDDDDQTGVW